MWRFRFWLIAAAVLVATGLLPLHSTDAADLQPATVLIFDRMNDGTIRILSDAEAEGVGMTVDAALVNMKERADGVLFLQTAEYLLFTERAECLLAQCTRHSALRPAASVAKIVGDLPDAEAAAKYLKNRPKTVTLGQLRAEAAAMPQLFCTNGGMLLRGT